MARASALMHLQCVGCLSYTGPLLLCPAPSRSQKYAGSTIPDSTSQHLSSGRVTRRLHVLVLSELVGSAHFQSTCERFIGLQRVRKHHKSPFSEWEARQSVYGWRA